MVHQKLGVCFWEKKVKHYPVNVLAYFKDLGGLLVHFHESEEPLA